MGAGLGTLLIRSRYSQVSLGSQPPSAWGFQQVTAGLEYLFGIPANGTTMVLLIVGDYVPLP